MEGRSVVARGSAAATAALACVAAGCGGTTVTSHGNSGAGGVCAPASCAALSRLAAAASSAVRGIEARPLVALEPGGTGARPGAPLYDRLLDRVAADATLGWIVGSAQWSTDAPSAPLAAQLDVARGRRMANPLLEELVRLAAAKHGPCEPPTADEIAGLGQSVLRAAGGETRVADAAAALAQHFAAEHVCDRIKELVDLVVGRARRLVQRRGTHLAETARLAARLQRVRGERPPSLSHVRVQIALAYELAPIVARVDLFAGSTVTTLAPGLRVRDGLRRYLGDTDRILNDRIAAARESSRRRAVP